MKIFMGKYRSWVGPYQLADILLTIGISEERCHAIGKYLSNTWLQTFCEWIDSFKKRKVKVKIHDYDIWGTPETLALIILPMLVMIRDAKAGCPWVDDGDVPEELRSINAPPKENEWEWDSLVFQRWDYVLDEMIWTFEQLQPDCDWEQQYHSGVIDFKFVQCEDNPNLSEMVNGPNDTWKLDKEGMDSHNDRINNGLRLFGKHFRSLWT